MYRRKRGVRDSEGPALGAVLKSLYRGSKGGVPPDPRAPSGSAVLNVEVPNVQNAWSDSGHGDRRTTANLILSEAL